MASALYINGKEGILDGSIDVTGDDIRVALLSAAYTPNLSAHKFVSDLTGIVARSGAIGSKTTTGGVFDAADVTVSAVTGSVVTQLVLFKHTGTDGTARLICLFDSGTGLPLTPSGADELITWSSGSSKIFAL